MKACVLLLKFSWPYLDTNNYNAVAGCLYAELATLAEAKTAAGSACVYRPSYVFSILLIVTSSA
jgi:hypothetical protein